MDDDQGQNTDLLDAPELDDSVSTVGDKAADLGQGLKSSAQSAKDVIGSARGGSGDGIGSALKNGLSSAGGAGSSTANPLSGLAGAGKSMDGMKGMGPNTPNMFKGLENNSNPAGKNDTSGDKQNPGASDFAKKAAGKTSAGQKAGQAVNDAVQTGREVKHAASAIASLGTDALDDAELAKDLAKAAAHPIQTAKRYSRVILYFAGFMFIQFALVFMILGAIFFGIYKVYLVVQEAVSDPWSAVTELRVTSEMGRWLIPTATQLVYERDLAAQKHPGIAVAQAPPNTPELRTNPETSKMYEAWQRAGLAETFLDDYGGRFEPSSSSSESDVNNPGSWDLIVNNQNFGPVTGTKAKAFIGIFAEETTHWKDIYTREALQGVAASEFNQESFLLDLPDSERDIRNSRLNTTKQLVSSTAEPLTERSTTYYKCLIEGLTNCDSLGLGSTNSGDNSSIDDNGTPLQDALAQLRQTVRAVVLQNTVGVEQIGQYAGSTADQVTPETSTYSTKNTLSANIRTGASDTILSSLPKEDGDDSTPSSSAILDLYDRYRAAVENENYARVNYDRESRQSIALAENYFIAGGQLINNEMGILDSWALTENLSVVTESPLFRSAVIGNPVGVFAQNDADDGTRSCQQIFNDLTPVGEVDQNIDRATTNTSCFRRSLVPDRATLLQDRSVNRIYSILEDKNREANQTGGFTKAIGDGFSKTRQKYLNQEIRTSPLATENISVAQDLSPDFDGYTNNTYGVARTGAEIDGAAYDSLATAGEALWAKALIDDEVGIGASYQTDEDTAEVMRYAQKIESQKMAFKPLGERLFAIKDSGSLVGKLAMMTPTNKEDGIKSTVALLKPSNLTSAIASRMTPATFAAGTKQVNPLRAVRTGYKLSDPSNNMPGDQLWERFNCGSGGVSQESSKPDGIPFILPRNTNPCKREVVLSKVLTCYFDTDDSCSFQDASTGVPGSITDDSSATPCYEGSEDLGVRDDAYTEGRQIRIRLCAINGMNSSSEESQPGGIPNANGRALASSISSEAWVKLVKLAQDQGIPLSASSTFRTMEHQQRLCNQNAACRGGSHTAVAEPGHSNHQSGTAMDIAEATGNLSSGATCESPATVGTATYQFLEANARTFGIKHYAKESWHWGTNESC